MTAGGVMHARSPEPGPGIFTSALVFRVCIGVAVVLVAVHAADLAFPSLLRGRPISSDFQAFWTAGRIFREGGALPLYDGRSVAGAVRLMTGSGDIYLWTYPPPFIFIAAALSLTPIWLGYLLFAAPALAAYLYLIRRIAGPWAPGLLAAAFPVVAINLIMGQNGLLTGALLGLFALQLPARGRWAGIALGLMVIKPHLALGAGLVSLLHRRWGVVALATATAVLAAMISTLTLTPAVWPAFFAALTQTTDLLASGEFPLHRMTSAYALLRSSGLGAGTAFAGQTVTAIAAVAAVVVASRRFGPRESLGLGLCCTAFMSPYHFDYDLTVFFVGLAVLAPAVLPLMRPRERSALLWLNWVSAGLPIASEEARRGMLLGRWLGSLPAVAISAPLLWATVILCIVALERGRRAQGEGYRPAPHAGLAAQ
jgi:hypothetical protein